MWKLLTLSSVLLIGITFFSCNGGNNANETELNHYKSVHDVSLSCGDYAAAENAIYNEWVLDTSDALTYKDSLINLFAKNGQYAQLVVLGKQILTKRPDDIVLMGRIGSADQSINNLDEALGYYHVIYSRLHDIYHLYQIALIQYNLSRLVECNETIDQVLADTASSRQTVPLSQGLNQPAQNVPYNAAALNMRGVIARDLKQTEAAKKAFNNALAIDPDFVIAKNNLENLNKQK